MEKKQIRLTEQDLHMLVEDAVVQILKENGVEEGFWSGMKSLMGGVGQKVGNAVQNAKGLYQAGSLNANVQKAVNQVNAALTNLQKVAQRLNYAPLAELCTRVEQELQSGVQQAAQQNLDAAKQRFVGGNQQPQGNGNQPLNNPSVDYNNNTITW